MARGSYSKQPSGRWMVRYYDTTGKQRAKGGFRTKGEAEAWHDQRKKEQGQGIDHHSDTTFSQLVEEYLAQHEASDARITVLRDRLKHAERAFGDTRLVDLTTRRLAMWRGGIEHESMRHYAFAAVKQVLAAGVAWKMIPESPASGVKNPAPKARSMEIIPDWDTVLELEAAMPVHYHGWLVVLVGTGLRPQEWPKLRWEHVDLDARVIRLPADIVKPKTPARNVPLRAQVATVLAARARKHGPVFCREDGSAVDIRYFRRYVWREAIIEANRRRVEQGRDPMPMMRPYDMRHTYATWGLRAGMNTFALAKRMGTSLEMIDQTYGHFTADSEDHERSMMDAFDMMTMRGVEVGA